jgi:hypothetical protein
MKASQGLSGFMVFLVILTAKIWGQVNTFPYNESFDGTFPPANWSVNHSSGGSDWSQTSSGTRTGSGAASSTDPGQNAHKYLSVAIDYSGSLAGSISYYLTRTSSPTEEKNVDVQYSTDGSTFSSLRSISVLNDLMDATYTQFIDDLPPSLDGVPIVVIRFDHTDATSASGPVVKLDDFQITSSGPVPIQLASCTASVLRGSEVEVQWKTVTETNNFGFEIYRKRGERGPWTNIGFVEGHGTTLARQSYSYLDRSVPFGKYQYRVRQIDLDGKSETFPEMEVNVGLEPGKFVLAQNYPNPFNPSTTIEFVVPQAGWMSLKVYNMLGQEIATLYDRNVEAGKVHTAEFNAGGLASGLYYYQLRGGGAILTRRMIVLR